MGHNALALTCAPRSGVTGSTPRYATGTTAVKYIPCDLSIGKTLKVQDHVVAIVAKVNAPAAVAGAISPASLKYAAEFGWFNLLPEVPGDLVQLKPHGPHAYNGLILLQKLSKVTLGEPTVCCTDPLYRDD
jgi:hypothetical protein